MLIFPISISSSWNRLIYSFKDHQCAIETQHFWNQMCYSSPKSAFPCPSPLPCLPFYHEALPVNHQLLRPTTFMSSCKLTLISNEFNSKFWNLYIQHITISTIQLTKSSTWITAKPMLRYSHSSLSAILPVLMQPLKETSPDYGRSNCTHLYSVLFPSFLPFKELNTFLCT